ncbi:MAG: hypothetical protein C0425_04555 [Chlorobiaceae bacterium]|nr:hypothetical protein [Chlorobiaceae bacterium]MBA4309587.1 hypothetical protein [Chlorobiaceae bacterium]
MWIILSLINPIVDASRNVFSKKASKNVDPLLISWFNNLIPVIVFGALLPFVELKFNTQFYISVICSGLINTVASILYHRAISKGNLSLVIPMLSFTPFFLIIVSPFMTGEIADSRGMIGIIFIVLGSYILNFELRGKNYLEPIKSLVKNKGTRYMLIVAFIWTFSANFDKLGVVSTSVIQYGFFLNLVAFFGISILLFSKRKFNIEQIKLERRNLLLLGFLTALGFLVHMWALSLTLVAYVIALKRTSSLLSVFFGYFYLNEKNIKERFAGATLMFIGVLLIVL